jgi:hypothetical protein
MSWLRELAAVVRALPTREKGLLAAIGLGIFGCFAVPFFQLGQFSMLRGTDNTCYYFWLRSAMVDRDWDFSNDLESCNTLTDFYRDEMRKQPHTETGLVANKYGIGWALLAAPFYVVADGVVAIGRGLGVWRLERDGYNPVYQIALQSGHFLIGLTGLLFAWRCVRHWCVNDRATLWGVVLILAASPQLYYLSMKLSMSHSAAFFAIALMTWSCLEVEKDVNRLWPWLTAGAGWGLAVILRFQLAVFILIPAWVWLTNTRGVFRKETALKSAGLWMAGALPLVLLQCYAWHVVYGHWLVFTYGVEGEGFNWTRPEVINVLFSAYHGWLYWHPFLLVGFGAFLWLVRWKGGLLWGALVAILATIYVNAAWWCWWFAGNSFGSRAFEAALLFFMGGLAMILIKATPVWRRFVWSAAILACSWNFYTMMLFYAGAIDRNAPVSWTEMVRAGLRLLK